jgi:hypothetical protein
MVGRGQVAGEDEARNHWETENRKTTVCRRLMVREEGTTCQWGAVNREVLGGSGRLVSEEGTRSRRDNREVLVRWGKLVNTTAAISMEA